MFTALQLGRYPEKVRLKAFGDGVRACGGHVLEIPDSDPRRVRSMIEGATRPSFAFSAGVAHREAAARGVLRAQGIPLLVLDLGFLRRATGPRDEHGFNQVGLNQLCWLPPGRSDSRTVGQSDSPTDLPSDRFESLGLPIAEPRSSGSQLSTLNPQLSSSGTLLVLGQKGYDAQHGMSSDALAAWLMERAARYWASGWSVVFRPHPEDLRLGFRLGQARRVDLRKEPLAANIAEATRALTFNSTAGLECLLAGVPVECNSTAHYAPFADLADPAAFRAYLHRLAWAQWSCVEMRTGECLRFMNRFARLLPDDSSTTVRPSDRPTEITSALCAAPCT